MFVLTFFIISILLSFLSYLKADGCIFEITDDAMASIEPVTMKKLKMIVVYEHLYQPANVFHLT